MLTPLPNRDKSKFYSAQGPGAPGDYKTHLFIRSRSDSSQSRFNDISRQIVYSFSFYNTRWYNEDSVNITNIPIWKTKLLRDAWRPLACNKMNLCQVGIARSLCPGDEGISRLDTNSTLWEEILCLFFSVGHAPLSRKFFFLFIPHARSWGGNL